MQRQLVFENRMILKIEYGIARYIPGMPYRYQRSKNQCCSPSSGSSGFIFEAKTRPGRKKNYGDNRENEHLSIIASWMFSLHPNIWWTSHTN
jgi:hypothetical protein